MQVLSLFDGMSCGQIALKQLNMQVEKYYASEVDKYAISVTQYNFPETIQLGDVTKWREWDIDWSKINLIIGGSPCQGFSFAGKQLAFDDERSKLFFVFVDILNHIKKHNPNAMFLLENVRMKEEYIEIISDYLHVNPIVINSSLVSAQNRLRFYWTNIAEIEQPEDRGIILKDVLEDGDCIGRMVGRRINEETGKRDDYNKSIKANQHIEKRNDNKSGTLTTVEKDNLVLNVGINQRDRGLNKGGKHFKKSPTLTSHSWEENNKLCIQVGEADLNGHESLKRVYSPRGKAPTLNTMSGGNREPKVVVEDNKTEAKNGKAHCITARYDGAAPWNSIERSQRTMIPTRESEEERNDYKTWRKLTPRECERLQTVPDDYTKKGNENGKVVNVSNSQRYKMLGNGWTVEVIKHIFSKIDSSLKPKKLKRLKQQKLF